MKIFGCRLSCVIFVRIRVNLGDRWDHKPDGIWVKIENQRKYTTDKIQINEMNELIGEFLELIDAIPVMRLE